MRDDRVEKWENARRSLIRRWERIIERIGEHDEAGVLELATEMDEFCDEAIAERAREGVRTAPARKPAAGPSRPGRAVREIRCVFCEGYRDGEGCLGVLAELNRAVFASNWKEADRLASDYLVRLRGMNLDTPGTGSVH